MIKRNGVEIKNQSTIVNKTKDLSIVQETLSILQHKYYQSPTTGNCIDISNEINYAIQNSIYYPNSLPNKEYQTITPIIEVINETTVQAAIRLQALGKTDIVALNFANATNPGGGFLAGSIAQEEDLCRVSGLYACLKNKPQYYNDNIKLGNNYYTDGIIYSPSVPFFRDTNNSLLDNLYKISIITSPAPAKFLMEDSDDDLLFQTFINRITKILQVAQYHNHKTIILGAFGCGAFGNDSNLVAEAFKIALQKIPAFEHITFAVFDKRQPPTVFETFKTIMER